MKLLRNFILIIGILFAVGALTRLSHVNAQAGINCCQDPFNQCQSLAQANQNNCLNNCAGQSNCAANCTSQYNLDMKTCNTNKTTCLTTGASWCQASVCPASCPAGQVRSSTYNDSCPNPSCDCVCACSAAPNCPNPTCINGTWECDSPILVDPNGEGFHLTSAADGVFFDFAGTGQPGKIAWTDSAFGNAWLVLDRNGNGRIDDAKELFGNLTPQPKSDHPNGYLALAEYD